VNAKVYHVLMNKEADRTI